MKIAHFIGAALLAALCTAGAAQARDQIDDNDAVVIDPAKAYVFFRTAQRQDVHFLRVITPEVRAEHETARAAAYAEAVAAYERRLARWERNIGECRASGITCREAPIRPSEEEFPFPSIESTNLVTVKRGPQFTRAEGAYTYLMAVTPGIYALHASTRTTQFGPSGVCLCMGSVAFEARAGQIVDLGEIVYPRLAAGDDGIPGLPGRVPSHSIRAPDQSTPPPARLAGFPVVPAEWRAADRVPNILRIEIDRMRPIDGILAYDRDRVIDLKARAAPTAPAPTANGGN
ncbi:hypothetical protein [Allosphingosinicella sp.]|jgi:hypothetical protein|uniref:hypothetical protein n=1 Tax=Allosphingosinicella sp. TaxID=2823234 RepID=UPI002F0D5278